MRSTRELGFLVDNSETQSNIYEEGEPEILETAIPLRRPELEDFIFEEKSKDESDGAEINFKEYSFTVEVIDHREIFFFELLNKFLEKIDQLSRLKENFDGEGSSQISNKNIQAVKTLIINIYSNYGILFDGIFPTQNGGIEIEAEKKYWDLSIIVNDPEKIEYLVKIGGKRKSGNGPLIDVPRLIWECLA